MTNTVLASVRRAANVMLVLGILASIAALVLGGFAVFAGASSTKSGGDWGGLTTFIALVAGGLALGCFLIAFGFLITQGFVRGGTPRACVAGIVVTIVAGLLPTAAVGVLWAGNDPSLGSLVSDVLILAAWLAPHAWIVALLRQALRETNRPDARLSSP
jgi:hypothetical protein